MHKQLYISPAVRDKQPHAVSTIQPLARRALSNYKFATEATQDTLIAKHQGHRKAPWNRLGSWQKSSCRPKRASATPWTSPCSLMQWYGLTIIFSQGALWTLKTLRPLNLNPASAAESMASATLLVHLFSYWYCQQGMLAMCSSCGSSGGPRWVQWTHTLRAAFTMICSHSNRQYHRWITSHTHIHGKVMLSKPKYRVKFCCWWRPMTKLLLIPNTSQVPECQPETRQGYINAIPVRNSTTCSRCHAINTIDCLPRV